MVEIEWHPKALDDLHNIYYFISRDSVYYAKTIILVGETPRYPHPQFGEVYLYALDLKNVSKDY